MARGESEIPSGDQWLSTLEVERACKIRFTKPRIEYLLRRWTCKQAVAVVAGLPGEPASLARIEIANRPSGAPVVRISGAPADLEVSLTDRAGWAVCLVAPAGVGVGCDLELVEPRSRGFVADFFTAAEQRYVASRSDADRDAVANLIWSAKESALKVLQTGLRRDTRSVEVSLGEPAGETPDDAGTGGWAPLETRTAEGQRMPGWWRRDGVFLVTVASELPLPPPSSLPGSADLRTAQPAHSWLTQPLTPW
jgi:4'-phosphopantetheinyl transferase